MCVDQYHGLSLSKCASSIVQIFDGRTTTHCTTVILRSDTRGTNHSLLEIREELVKIGNKFIFSIHSIQIFDYVFGIRKQIKNHMILPVSAVVLSSSSSIVILSIFSDFFLANPSVSGRIPVGWPLEICLVANRNRSGVKWQFQLGFRRLYQL